MDENLSLIIHGSRLAKELEASLDNKSFQTEDVASRCDHIARIFGTAAERLRGKAHDHSNVNYTRPVQEIPAPQPHSNIDPSLIEWLVSGFTQGMDVINQSTAVSTQATPISAMDLLVSTTRTSSATSHRQRRRRVGDSETRIVKMAAPQIGNTEIPPEDGYTWRKYGQKEIMGKKYPRSYYRCTHQRQFNCPAKKQVQRDELDPSTFDVMYRGNHTCHLSATAPSMLPSQPLTISHDMQPMVTPSTITSSLPLGNWLSMEFGGASSSGAGTSARFGDKELNTNVPDFPVVDMADAMFNSGSSSTSNSMDFLFPSSMEEHNNNKDK